MDGAVFHASRYGSSAQNAKWIGAACKPPDPVASEEELKGFDFMDKDGIAPVGALATEFKPLDSAPPQPEMATRGIG